MKDIKGIIIVSIIPLIGLCIGVFHKKPEYGRTRSEARCERREKLQYSTGWYNTGHNWILDRGSLSQ